MIASDFEYRHQTLIHQSVVAVALVTYLFDREDIVWRFVKDSAAPRPLERALFIAATIAIAVGAWILTWSRANGNPESSARVGSYRFPRRSQSLGDLLYALGLATLFPLSGFVILVGGEIFRVYRLNEYANHSSQSVEWQPSRAPTPVARTHENDSVPRWAKAFRKEAVKWGVFLTMIVFVITLTDRLAEYLIAASFLVGILLNAPVFSFLSNTKASR
jgi:hypothetical protein